MGVPSIDVGFAQVDIVSAAAIALLFGVLLDLWQRSQPSAVRDALKDRRAPSSHIEAERPYTDIQPLPDFDLAATPVPFNAVFKPKYHITMGLENISMSDLLAMDRSYVRKLHLRRTIMDQNPEVTIQSNPVASEAVFELYEWMFGTYLPKRFPTVYKIVDDDRLLNTAMDEHIPLHRPSSARAALRTLGDHVDADFNVLLPLSTGPDGLSIYHLEAFVLAFPSGFNIKHKLGLPLSGVHKPVPGYKARLGRSMDKTFAKLEVGKAVKRSNWTITTDDQLFDVGGTHFHADEAQASATVDTASDAAPSEAWQAEIERQRAQVVVDNCRLRSERQVLFRLPKTKALVFSFKTYQYTIADVKAAGLGPALTEAIEGLKLGNVPEFQFYKRGVVWGPKVIEYLRS